MEDFLAGASAAGAGRPVTSRRPATPAGAPHEGGCLCGAIRYRVTGPPVASGICHCRTCRKAASAPALPFAMFPASSFAVIAGRPAAIRSSARVTRSFCGRCGSPLTYRSDDEPDFVDVMTCSLDRPEAFAPRFHVWVSHCLAWERPGGGLPAFATTRAAAARAPSGAAASPAQPTSSTSPSCPGSIPGGSVRDSQP